MIPDQIATTSPALPQVLNNGFFGPFVKSWSEFDCPTVGTVEETSTVDECQKLCLSKEKCNVINRKVDGTGKCRMLQCPTGKRPNNFDSLSQGFSLYKGEANW
jgi:streptogramin lyase